MSAWKPAAVANGLPGGVFPGISALMDEAFKAAQTLTHRSDFAGWSEVGGRNEFRLSLAALKQLAEEVGMAPSQKRITPRMERASSVFQRGFLRGLFDADGSVQWQPG